MRAGWSNFCDRDKSRMTVQDVSVNGHFGEWLQGRMGRDGPVALVTVPCPVLRICTPGRSLSLFPSAELARFARLLGVPPRFPGTGRHMPTGAGAGSSTATLVALARSAGFAGSAQTLADACIALEGASDPLMFTQPDALLWASRQGRILRHMSPPPRCTIIGGFHGPNQRTDPRDSRFADISDLVDAWAAATAAGDLRRVATLASASAARCCAERGPADDPTPGLAHALGALGWLRAHTGSARGLIFAPGAVPAGAVGTVARAGFRQVIAFETGGT